VYSRCRPGSQRGKDMADFRRLIPVVAVIGILMGVAPRASATFALSCIAGGAVIPELRSEGIAELTGDLVYNCVGGVSTPQSTAIPKVTIEVFMNSPLAITSRLIGNGTEALLMIDEPAEADQVPCPTPLVGCDLLGVGAASASQQNAYKVAGATLTAPNGPRYSVFQGVLGASNSVVFNGAPLDPPGAALDAIGQPLVRVIRITNIRVNASASYGTPGITNLTVLTTANPSSAMPLNQQSAIQTTAIIPTRITADLFQRLPAGRIFVSTVCEHLECFRRRCHLCGGIWHVLQDAHCRRRRHSPLRGNRRCLTGPARAIQQHRDWIL
jgi:hypothetical protein